MSTLPPSPDPQVDEDVLIQRIRTASKAALAMAETWRGYAAGQRLRAAIDRQRGEPFDADLKDARAGVRTAAADLLLSGPPAEAAQEMMHRAAAFVVREPPLMGYDQAARQYTLARSWQWCAQQIDPTLPEIQPRWT